MQALWSWNIHLHCDIGYMCDTETGSSIIMVHVDDMATAASNKVEVAKLKEELGNLFSLMDIGELKWLVGIAITHNQHSHTISLFQAAYIESIPSDYTLRMHIWSPHLFIHMLCS